MSTAYVDTWVVFYDGRCESLSIAPHGGAPSGTREAH